ncbi:MAG: S8 family serine peptidase [Planctomycetota bacterium]
MLTVHTLARCALIACASTPLALFAQTTHVYRYKERIELTPDTTRVAEIQAGRVKLRSALAAGPTRAEAHADLFTAPVFIDDLGGAMFPSRHFIVRFASDTDADTARDLVAAAGGAVIETDFGGMPGVMRAHIDTLDGSRVLEAANRLAQLDRVRFAEPEFVFTGRGAHALATSAEPSDPLFRQQWHLENTGLVYQGVTGAPDFDIDILGAWSITRGDPETIVVVLDTGVAPHPDLPPITLGADFTNDPIETGAPFNTCDRHGTAVAGLIAAIADNERGGAGVAPNITLASARVFTSNPACDGSWTASSSQTVAALAWARQIGARVTCNANSYGFQSAAVADAYEAARAEGIVHIASAGNSGANAPNFPASLDSVLAVGATAADGTLAPFSNTGLNTGSNTGAGIAFVAPGVALPTTDRPGGAGYTNNDSVLFTGTSASAPVAAGVAALLASHHPEFTPAHIAQRLADTCLDLGQPGFDTAFGAGQLNARDALALTACSPADITGAGLMDGVPDGRVTLSDFTAYVARWSLGDPRADITPDGACEPEGPLDGVTLSDLSCYLAIWDRGCP